MAEVTGQLRSIEGGDAHWEPGTGAHPKAEPAGQTGTKVHGSPCLLISVLGQVYIRSDSSISKAQLLSVMSALTDSLSDEPLKAVVLIEHSSALSIDSLQKLPSSYLKRPASNKALF